MKIHKANLNASSSSLYGKYLPGDIVLGLCDATNQAFTVYVPSAKSTMISMFIFKKTDSSANAVTLSFKTGETADGATTASLASQYSTLVVINDQQNYHKIAEI